LSASAWDRLPEGPAPQATTAVGTAWEHLLSELEMRLAAWRGALDGSGRFPEGFEWPSGLDRCPGPLRARARRILAAQRDIEREMAERQAALGSVLHGSDPLGRQAPPPLFLDLRC
jgi:hypothetical protein